MKNIRSLITHHEGSHTEVLAEIFVVLCQNDNLYTESIVIKPLFDDMQALIENSSAIYLTVLNTLC